MKKLLICVIFVLILSGCDTTENLVISDPLPTHDGTDTQDTPTQVVDYNLEEIIIEEPGDLSEVTSPIFVSGLAGPSFEQNIVIRLTDVNGVMLAEQATNIMADIGTAGAFFVELEFDIPEEGYGRITTFYTSPMNGSMLHAASVPLTLLPSGTSIMSQNLDSAEVIEITSPVQDSQFSSGQIVVNGTSEYFFESTLVLALCGSGGNGTTHPICGTEDNTLALGYAMIDSPDVGIGGDFSGTLEFLVTEEMPATLLVYAVSPMDGGLEHLNSVFINLVP